MKDLTPKLDDTAGAQGQLAADEFNDFANDVQNAIIESGQALTGAVGDDNLQLHKAIAAGGKRRSLGDGSTAGIGDIVIPENGAADITIDLPSVGLFQNAVVIFEPVVDQFYSSFSLTIGRNGNNIMGLAEDVDLNNVSADNAVVMAKWVAGSIGWKLMVIGVVGRTT